LLNHMHEEASPSPDAEVSLGGLMERTSELTEDINERSEVAMQVAEAEQREASEEMAEDESLVESEEQ